VNLEHLQMVKARIEEIRRRFVDLQGLRPGAFRGPSEVAASGFQEALHQAHERDCIPCPEELEPVIARAADRYGVDPAVIKAVIRAESGFRSDAVSRVGALGFMQLMPGTARALGVDPTDTEQNIDGGTRYLKQQIDRFGSLELALAAYNAGPGTIVRYGGMPPYAETRRYVEDVLSYMDFYSEGR